MKTAQDLVLLAKAHIVEISIDVVEDEIRSSDVVLDVREPDEFAVGHIQGSVNVPRGLLEFKMSLTESLVPRDLRIVIYCKNGGRSALSAKTLQEMGYLNIKALAGGFDAWAAAGKPVAKIPHPELG